MTIRSRSLKRNHAPSHIISKATIAASPVKKPDLVLLTLSIFKISYENHRLSVVSMDSSSGPDSRRR
ncbi:putative cyclin-SDS [Sesbania bispinosa]|nr:putative cyclin-SDS [Sesbania bispinosa]